MAAALNASLATWTVTSLMRPNATYYDVTGAGPSNMAPTVTNGSSLATTAAAAAPARIRNNSTDENTAADEFIYPATLLDGNETSARLTTAEPERLPAQADEIWNDWGSAFNWSTATVAGSPAVGRTSESRYAASTVGTVVGLVLVALVVVAMVRRCWVRRSPACPIYLSLCLCPSSLGSGMRSSEPPVGKYDYIYKPLDPGHGSRLDDEYETTFVGVSVPLLHETSII